MLTRSNKQSINAINTINNSSENKNNDIDQVKSGTNKLSMANKLNVTLPEFSGDSNKTFWFVNQVKELSEINAWDDKTALFFLKSRLTGSALTYFQNDPSCQTVKTLNEACQKLLGFFSVQESPAAELRKFQNITLAPDESIKNLSYRIDLAAQKSYRFINDVNALNKIKSMQFIAALPISIKEKILLQGEMEYNEMVAKAQHIQTIQESLMNPTNPFVAAHSEVKLPPVSSDSDQLLKLSQKVDMLSISLNELAHKCPLCRENNHCMAQCPLFYSQNLSPQPTANLSCAYCGKNNHIMQNCHKFQQLTAQNHNKRFQPNHQTYRNVRHNNSNAYYSSSQNVQHSNNASMNNPRGFTPQGASDNTIPKSVSQNYSNSSNFRFRNPLNLRGRR